MSQGRRPKTQTHAARPILKRGSSLRTIEIDFLYLDLTACTRCLGTDQNLERAVQKAAEVLKETGIKVQVNKILIESADQARALRFVSSPTIRVNGRDIALEMKESRCESCESCVCGETVACRVWMYGGMEYTEAPVGMIVEAILREVYGGPQRAPVESMPLGDLPENLNRFFIGKARKEAAAVSACCSPDQEASCCEPSEKTACCGTSEDVSCGCR